MTDSKQRAILKYLSEHGKMTNEQVKRGEFRLAVLNDLTIKRILKCDGHEWIYGGCKIEGEKHG